MRRLCVDSAPCAQDPGPVVSRPVPQFSSSLQPAAHDAAAQAGDSAASGVLGCWCRCKVVGRGVPARSYEMQSHQTHQCPPRQTTTPCVAPSPPRPFLAARAQRDGTTPHHQIGCQACSSPPPSCQQGACAKLRETARPCFKCCPPPFQGARLAARPLSRPSRRSQPQRMHGHGSQPAACSGRPPHGARLLLAPCMLRHTSGRLMARRAAPLAAPGTRHHIPMHALAQPYAIVRCPL